MYVAQLPINHLGMVGTAWRSPGWWKPGEGSLSALQSHARDDDLVGLPLGLSIRRQGVRLMSFWKNSVCALHYGTSPED